MLADDHWIVRHGLRTLIEAEPDLEIAAVVDDGARLGRRRARPPRSLRPSARPTVSDHIASLKDKVGAASVIDLVLYAWPSGLVE